MKFFITGKTGLLGSEIARLSPQSQGVGSKECDLLTADFYNVIAESFLDKSDNESCVIHCASRVGGVKANTDKVSDFFSQNILMNQNVLEGCKKAKIKCLSILSTCVYPDEKYVKYTLTEDQLHLGPPHHSNFGYAYAKRMIDVQSRAYRQQYDCNFITVIPNNLYGLNDNYDLDSGHVVPALIRKFHEAKLRGDKKVSIWGSGRPVREFTFARDAAKIILWLAENYDGVNPVNIGNSEQVSIHELAMMISRLAKFEGNLEFDSTKPDGQFQKPSSSKRLSELGWNGTYTSLEEGLAETIEHFQKVYPDVRGVTIGS